VQRSSIIKIRNVVALAALAASSQLLHATPASAASIARDRQSTDLVVRLLGDARSARVALIGNDAATANKDIDSAFAVDGKLVRIAHENGKSMIVQIYTELDDNARLSDDVLMPEGISDETRSAHIKALEVTYFAINLDKTRTRLEAARRALRENDDQSAEKSLAAIRSDLVHGNDAVDVPLLAARRELALAQRDIRSKGLGAASADLERASDSLNSYSSVGHSAAAHELASEIKSSMRISAQSGSSMSTKIDGWWASVKTWFSQHA
jgi:hypothetical protein